MKKKGKFKLLSYVVDGNHIFYESIKKKKKIISFLILEVQNLLPAISIFNNFLIKRFLNYYSIQIYIKKPNLSTIFINIEDDKKSKIIRMSNLIKKEIEASDSNVKFLSDKDLEEAFLRIITHRVNEKIALSKKAENFLIKYGNVHNYFDFFSINFNFINNQNYFIQDFLNYIKNYDLEGYFIFNINVIQNNEIVISPYLFTISEDTEKLKSTIGEINDFYETKLLEKVQIKFKNIAYLLWRYKITGIKNLLNSLSKLFNVGKYHPFKNINPFNKQFEKKLLKNNIDFVKINDYLLFINYNYVVVALFEFKPNFLLKIFKKYYSKYFIYLLALDDATHSELLKKQLNVLNNLKILSHEEFNRLDYKVFKNCR